MAIESLPERNRMNPVHTYAHTQILKGLMAELPMPSPKFEGSLAVLG